MKKIFLWLGGMNYETRAKVPERRPRPRCLAKTSTGSMRAP